MGASTQQAFSVTPAAFMLTGRFAIRCQENVTLQELIKTLDVGSGLNKHTQHYTPIVYSECGKILLL